MDTFPNKHTILQEGRADQEIELNPFAPKLKKCILPNFKKQLYERRSENLYSIITFHLSKLCKVKFFILRECHISCEVPGEF